MFLPTCSFVSQSANRSWRRGWAGYSSLCLGSARKSSASSISPGFAGRVAASARSAAAATLAPEGAAATGLRVRHLPSSGIGDLRDRVPPDADGPAEMVPRRLSAGPRQARVSAKFLQRELGVAYQTAWTIAHKLRHALSEIPLTRYSGFLEADESFIGGRGDPSSPGRSRKTRQEPGRRGGREGAGAQTRRASTATR